MRRVQSASASSATRPPVPVAPLPEEDEELDAPASPPPFAGSSTHPRRSAKTVPTAAFARMPPLHTIPRRIPLDPRLSRGNIPVTMDEVGKIVGLLKSDAIEKQITAAIVMGELKAKGPGVVEGLAGVLE